MREDSVRQRCQRLILVKSIPGAFFFQGTEIPVAGGCNTLPKLDIFCFAIILDILCDNSWRCQSMTQVQPYGKGEPCYQSVSHSSSPVSHPGVPSQPESWHGSAASHHRQQNTAVSLIISRDNELLRDREDVQPLSSSPVSRLEEADHSLATVNAGLCSQRG